MDDFKQIYRADPKKNIVVPKNLFQWIRMAFISPANYLLIFQDLKLTKASSYFVLFTLINLFLFFLGLFISRTKYDISLSLYVMSNSYLSKYRLGSINFFNANYRIFFMERER